MPAPATDHPAARGFAAWLDEHRYPWPVLTVEARAALWARFVVEKLEEARRAA